MEMFCNLPNKIDRWSKLLDWSFRVVKCIVWILCRAMETVKLFKQTTSEDFAATYNAASTIECFSGQKTYIIHTYIYLLPYICITLYRIVWWTSKKSSYVERKYLKTTCEFSIPLGFSCPWNENTEAKKFSTGYSGRLDFSG